VPHKEEQVPQKEPEGSLKKAEVPLKKAKMPNKEAPVPHNGILGLTINYLSLLKMHSVPFFCSHLNHYVPRKKMLFLPLAACRPVELAQYESVYSYCPKGALKVRTGPALLGNILNM